MSLSNPRQREGEEEDEEADMGWTAESLMALLETHKTSKVCSQLFIKTQTTHPPLQAGLPILLTVNCSPDITGPIPLIPSERDDTGQHSPQIPPNY